VAAITASRCSLVELNLKCNIAPPLFELYLRPMPQVSLQNQRGMGCSSTAC
jgi:hypothetical protein